MRTLTLTNAADCAVTLTLPSEAALAPDVCGRLAVTVAPRRLVAGRLARVRVTVARILDGGRQLVAPGARVSVGRSVATTDAAGHATLRYRPVGAGTRRLRVTLSGLPPAISRLRVVAR